MLVIVPLVLAYFQIVKEYGECRDCGNELVVTLGRGDILCVHRHKPFNWVLLTQVENVLKVSFSHSETRLFNLRHDPHDGQILELLKKYSEEKVSKSGTLYQTQIDMVDRENQFMLIVPIEAEPGDFDDWRRVRGLDDALKADSLKRWTLQAGSGYWAVVFKTVIEEEGSSWCQLF